MKKASHLLFILFFCCAIFFVSANASNESITSSVRIDLPNGDYVIETVAESTDTPITRATNTKSGHKTSVYYNSSNVAIFGVRVDGAFSYTGTTSWSTSGSATVYIYDSSASYISKSASHSSNYASATGKVKYNYVTIPRTVTLYCDKNGNLS